MVKLFLFILNFVYILSTVTGNTSNPIQVTARYSDYKPTWESLDSRPLPDWYDQSKVGIFIHWGVYSVPAFGSEWFWWYLRGQRKPAFIEFMAKNYKPGYTYQEFAHQFTAEHFNPNDWAELFEKSGARYIVLTSKHHEGFTLWPSKYSFSWNSVDVGPHRDIVGELRDAIVSNTTLKFGLYYSLFEWFNPMYTNDEKNQFKQNIYASQKAIPELKDLVNTYEPEIVWSDGDQGASDGYWNSKEFLAWLYNDSPVRDTVVVNDRWGTNIMCHHGGYYTCDDRYNPGTLQKHKFENAMTIDRSSWGYVANTKLEDYLSTHELISELVSTISCGGNILVNVGPNRYGIIEPIFQERLTDMGAWLKMNGDAIYGTIPWKFQNDTQTPNVWYTSKVVTIDEQHHRLNVYAIILDYPFKDNGIKLFALSGCVDDNSKISMLGVENTLTYTKNEDSIYVKFPKKKDLDNLGLQHAWALKVDIPY